jgi:hypothetical protein
MAASLRILLHQTARSDSLLGLLGIRQQPFVDACFEYDPENLAATHGLVGVMADGTGARFYAALDDHPHINNHLPFSKWWEKVVIADYTKRTITRRQLVLFVSNQDGGAHVDEKLDRIYYELKNNQILGYTYKNSSGESSYISDPQMHSLRQITHEVLKTLVPEYEKRPSY